MGVKLLGRTNCYFPTLWFSLQCPQQTSELSQLVESCIEKPTVLDVTACPVLFGNFLRNHSQVPIKLASSFCLEHAVDESQAYDFMQAEILQGLCTVSRSSIDFFMLSIRVPLEEFQINGAIRAFENSIQEGDIKYLGLRSVENHLAALGIWQFRDAFTVLETTNSSKNLSDLKSIRSLAHSRRVGMIIKIPFDSSTEHLKSDFESALQYGVVSIPVNSPPEVTQSRYAFEEYFPDNIDQEVVKEGKG